MAGRDLRAKLTWLALAVALVAIVIRAQNSGWAFLLFGPIYVVIGIVHVIVHRRVSLAPRFGRTMIAAVALSHVSLLAAPLLQSDFGDSSGTTLTIEQLLPKAYSRDLRENFPRPNDFLLFVPVVMSWVALTLSARDARAAVAALAAAGVATALPLLLVGAVVIELVQASNALQSQLTTAARGAPPTSCGSTSVPRLQSSQNGYADGSFGEAPVWLKNYPFTARAGDIVMQKLGSAVASGKGVFTTWFVKVDFMQPITVQLVDRATGDPVRASPGLRAAAAGSQAVRFDPYEVNPVTGVTRNFREHTATFFLPRAGCYIVKTTWEGGGWLLSLAAGE